MEKWSTSDRVTVPQNFTECCGSALSQARKNCRISWRKPGRRASWFQTQCVSIYIIRACRDLRLQEKHDGNGMWTWHSSIRWVGSTLH